MAETYLPVESKESIWRYSRRSKEGDLDQGWKLHISATILTANTIFERVVPYLTQRGLQFKAPRSLDELQKINCGLYYGYSQVGKFITVYPRSPDEAVMVARKLDGFTRGLTAPVVPFDSQLRTASCVYYRYGSFIDLEVENDGKRLPAMRDLLGNLVPDSRIADQPRPAWVDDPFDRQPSRKTREFTPLTDTFRAFQSLAQRGKGGVYKAIDQSAQPPRLCMLKEGRRHGETTWDGRDGWWLVKREAEVLRSLLAAGLDVPVPYATFEVSNNYYLAIEFVNGESLHTILGKMKRRLSLRRVMVLSIQLADLLAGLHASGWAWRDCKPANLILTRKGKLVPIDFEGAIQIDQPDDFPWRTAAFAPPEDNHKRGGSSAEADDLYALGAVIFFMLTGRVPEPAASEVTELRKGVPQPVSKLVAALLSWEPDKRPRAREASLRLSHCLK